jgi:hypothetical protein
MPVMPGADDPVPMDGARLSCLPPTFSVYRQAKKFDLGG